MEDPLPLVTPGVNLLFSKWAYGSDVITRDVLVELVTMCSPDEPAQIEPIVERIAELVGAAQDGSITLPELDSAFQEPSLKDFLRHLFGSPEVELFAAHSGGTPTLPRAHVEQLVVDRGQGEHLGLLLHAMGDADTIVEDGFVDACDAHPCLMSICFGDGPVPGWSGVEADAPPASSAHSDAETGARSAATSTSFSSPVAVYGSAAQSTPLPGPGRPRSFTREDSFISEVEDSDLVSPTTRSPAAMTASRSHSAESYSSAAAAAAARARSVGMARIRVRMPVDDSGIFSSPEPGNRSYDSPDEGDMAAMRPRAGTLHSADAGRAASRESVQSTDIDRPASRQSSRFSETGRYNSDTKQRALESLFEAANTSESDRLGPNELYTFLQNPDISGKAGTEMASMFGMLPKSFFATMFQTIDTDFGTGNGLGGGLDKQGFAEAFSDMFDENGNYYIPTDAVGSQLRALFAEYTELIREVDETKFGHERDIQQQRHELKQSQALRAHLEAQQLYDSSRIEQLEAEADRSRLENVELRNQYEDLQAQVADMHQVYHEIDEHRAALDQLAQDNVKLRRQSKKDGELEETLARVQSKYEHELTGLSEQLEVKKRVQEETAQEYVKYVEEHPSRPVSRRTSPGTSQSKLEPMETGGDRLRDLELTRSLIREGLETLLNVVEHVADGSEVAWTGGLIDPLDANLEIGEDCRTMLIDVEGQMKTLMSMAFKLARKARDATAEALAEGREQIEDLVSQIEGLKTELKRLQASDVDATGVRSALTLLMKKHERLKADLADSVPASALADIARLKAELANSVPAAVLAGVQRQLDAVQRQLAEVEHQLQSSEDEKDTVKVSLTLNTAAQKRAEQALLALQRQFGELEQRCDASEAAQQQRHAENDVLRQERTLLEDTVAKLLHDLDGLAGVHDATVDALAAANTGGEIVGAQVRALQQRLAAAQAASETGNANLALNAAAAEREISALKQELAAASKAHETVRISLTMNGAAADRQIQDLRARLAEAARATETIRVSLTMTTAAADRHAEELTAALAVATKNAETIRVSLTLSTAAAERQLAQVHRRLRVVTDDLDAARGKLTAERDARHSTEVEVARVGSELKVARNQLAAAEAALEARATVTPTRPKSDLGDVFDRMQQLQAGMDTAKLRTQRRSKDAQASTECSIRELQAQLSAVQADLVRERAVSKAYGAARARAGGRPAEDPSVLRASLLATQLRLDLSERSAEELALAKGELTERLGRLESVHGAELRKKDGKVSEQVHELDTQRYLLNRRNIQSAALGSRAAALEGQLAALLQVQRERDLADRAGELVRLGAETAATVQVTSHGLDSDSDSDFESGTESGVDGVDEGGSDGGGPAVTSQARGLRQQRGGMSSSDATLIQTVEDLLYQGTLSPLDSGLEQRVDNLTRENLKLWEVVKSMIHSGALPTSTQIKAPAKSPAPQMISAYFENLAVLAVDSKLGTTPTFPKRIDVDLADGHVSVLRTTGDFIARWPFCDVAQVIAQDHTDGRCTLELGDHAGVTIDLDVGRLAGSFVRSIRAKISQSKVYR